MTQSFIVAKEHRRFTESANAVKKERTIGICHGDAGVGKTNSAPPLRQLGHPRALHHRVGPTERGRRETLRARAPLPHRLLHTRGPPATQRPHARHQQVAGQSRNLHRRTPPHTRESHRRAQR